jgi:hypothetical protein
MRDHRLEVAASGTSQRNWGDKRMNGWAYAYLRQDGAPLPPGHSGHVGWGFQTEHGHFFAGSTENTSGAFFVPPGGDNGAWATDFSSEADMFEAFRKLNYDAGKRVVVRDVNAVAARGVALQNALAGYTGLGNNCLDHVWRVLSAYGDPGLPFMQNHPSPNDWFAVFNGEWINIQKPD